ncbi:MAG: HAD-IB family hydrolase [Actinomycetota bacterium]|nr:HAD-IB family hydrolase [Actinomycetota bacterium]
MPSPGGAAFFDLDRTLIAGSANFALAVAAFGSDLVGPADLARDALNAVGFVVRGADDARSEALRDRILRAVAGRDVAELDALGDRIVPRMAASVFPEARRELARHARAGRDRVIVSASPQEVVAKLAEELGLEGAVGTRAEVVEGRYTGSLAGPFCYADNKPAEVRRLAAERGYDLAASTAYSDAVSDLPFLECVGEPVAMNPDAPLRAVAVERGWRTVEVASPHRTAGAALGRFGRQVHRAATDRVRGRHAWT